MMLKSIQTIMVGLRSRRFALASVSLLIAVTFGSVLFCPAPSASVIVIPRRVLALYYPWYGSPEISGEWQHQGGVNIGARTIASHTHYPLSGPYDSMDSAVIDRHLRQAKSAGIDTLVCSWWGRNDRTDQGIRMLLKQAPKHSMTICVLWEPFRSALTPQDARADLDYILQAFAKQPGYLRCGNRPVVFLYSQTSQGLAPERWAEILKEASRQSPHGVLAITDYENQANPFVGDGSYALWPITRMGGSDLAQSAQMLHTAFQPQISWKREFNRLTVETIAPGYDDRKFSVRAESGPGTLVDRQNGQLYRGLWEQAFKDAPDWVLINSFNQWHNGTEIEPSQEMGNEYLQLTGAYARRFKAGNASPIHRP